MPRYLATLVRRRGERRQAATTGIGERRRSPAPVNPKPATSSARAAISRAPLTGGALPVDRRPKRDPARPSRE